MNLLEENQKINNGEYVVEHFIGAGAFAEVYRVEHHLLGPQAMKIFKTPGTIDEVRFMLEEARLLTGLGHPNIIRVFNAGIHNSSTGTHGFFTMEYLDGGNLANYRLKHEQRLIPVPVALDILRQVSLGLSCAHVRNPPLVHRDIKPQNILVEKSEKIPRVCISDFGLAKHVNPIILKASTRGTPSFRAPECAGDANAASCASDVWSLGLTIYLMLTDRFPYSGADLDDIRYEHYKRPLYPASKINGGIDKGFDAILTRALAIDPAERYPHVMALLCDLEEWQNKKMHATLPVDQSAESEARDLLALTVKTSRDNTAEAAKLLKKAMELYPPFREEYRGLLKALLENKTA
jgi:serine/threonine-protein kinase